MKDTLFERLLDYFQISEEQYKQLIAPVSAQSFAYGRSFKDMDKAVALVKEAVNNKDIIFVYGDYDADGIMSTSILVKSLLLLGVVPKFYIPNRYNDGYGINMNKAKEIVDAGVKLVITVDNGISANEPIAYLKDNGVKVLIIDHHTVPEEIPNADAIIHPTFSGFGETSSSAGFASFMFSWALLGRFDKYLSTLAAISLITDMMPLREYNRDFLRLVFENYRDGEFYSIDLLKEGLPFDENTIGMKIGPKINACGRLIDDDSINYVVHYFVTNKREKMDKLARWISDTNQQRKEESKNTFDFASMIDENDKAIILLSDAKEGLIGLIANNVCSIYKKPTIVFTEEKDAEILKGSCRASEGFNVVDAFNSCKDIIITSGGHALAGGCSIYKKDFETFKKCFTEYVINNPIVVAEQKTIPLGLTEINNENYALIQSFSPFGEGWRAPDFKLSRIRSASLTFSRGGEHLISYIGQNVKIVGFGFSKSKTLEFDYIDVVGRLKESTYRGMTSIEFNIKNLSKSGK